MKRGSLNLASEAADLDSSFEEEEEDEEEEDKDQQGSSSSSSKKRRRKEEERRGAGGDLRQKERAPRVPKASSSQFSEEVALDEGRRQRFQILSLNAYDRHKKLVNDYLLYFPGSTDRLQRDTTRDRTDMDVIKEHHRFLWEEGEGKESESELSWGQRLAKKYCQRLFKEYCICDLSRYKENKVAMRWRTEEEVREGKGQFACGERKCAEKEEVMRTWEVNFAYEEGGERKNALVKVRLCPDCSYRLNYHHKRKELVKKSKKKKEKKKKRGKRRKSRGGSGSEDSEVKQEEEDEKKVEKVASKVWSAPLEVEQEKSREEDFSEYLEDLFL